MARAGANLQANMANFSSKAYMQSWYARNPYYTNKISREYEATNAYTDAAIRSGVVRPGGYGLPPELLPRPQVGSILPGGKIVGNMSDPRLGAGAALYDQFGNLNKQKANAALGWAQMDINMIPAVLRLPTQNKYGGWERNALDKFLRATHPQQPGVSAATSQFRIRTGTKAWSGLLTKSYSSFKGPSSSSRANTRESYSTMETQFGKSLYAAPGEASGRGALNPDIFAELKIPSVKPEKLKELGVLYNPDTIQTELGPVRKSFRNDLWGTYDTVFGSKSATGRISV